MRYTPVSHREAPGFSVSSVHPKYASIKILQGWGTAFSYESSSQHAIFFCNLTTPSLSRLYMEQLAE
jgi:hypothetical protein